MAKASELKNGNFIKFNGELVQIIEFIHRTPGNLRAFYQAKMKNVKTGRSAEYRFRVDEEVEPVRVETRVLQYLYPDGENFVCMDPDTFDQIHIHESLFGDRKVYLKEEMNVTIAFEGDLPLSAEPPTFVELEITYSEPGIRGDTVSNTLKPAMLETGTEVRVPMFINQGDRIKVDTRTGEYVERVK